MTRCDKTSAQRRSSSRPVDILIAFDWFEACLRILSLLQVRQRSVSSVPVPVTTALKNIYPCSVKRESAANSLWLSPYVRLLLHFFFSWSTLKQVNPFCAKRVKTSISSAIYVTEYEPKELYEPLSVVPQGTEIRCQWALLYMQMTSRHLLTDKWA